MGEVARRYEGRGSGDRGAVPDAARGSEEACWQRCSSSLRLKESVDLSQAKEAGAQGGREQPRQKCGGVCEPGTRGEHQGLQVVRVRAGEEGL